MNYQKIIKYNNLRQQLTPEEILFANALHEATDSERELLVESLSPEKPTNRRGASKSSRQVSKSSSKSSRASGMAAAINRSLSQQRQPLCAHVSDDGDDPTTCGEAENNPIHDPAMGYGGYHEFTPGKSPARSVGEKLSTNGGETNSTQNSEVETGSVLSVTGG